MSNGRITRGQVSRMNLQAWADNGNNSNPLEQVQERNPVHIAEHTPQQAHPPMGTILTCPSCNSADYKIIAGENMTDGSEQRRCVKCQYAWWTGRGPK